MFRNFFKIIFPGILIFLFFSTLSCPNDQMRDLVEIKISDPVADLFIVADLEGDPETASTRVILNSVVTKEEDALEMRFRNKGYSWTDWEPYSSTRLWDTTYRRRTKKKFMQNTVMKDTMLFSMVNSINLDTGSTCRPLLHMGKRH